MARLGGYRVGINRKAKPFTIIMGIVMLFIWLYVGDMVINVIMDIQRTVGLAPEGGIYGTGPTYTTYYWVPQSNIFYNVYQLFGVHTNEIGNTTGLIGVIGIIIGVGILMQAIRITKV